MVHKKKVGEVRAWLQAQAAPGAARGVPRLLFVTGAVPRLGCSSPAPKVTHVMQSIHNVSVCPPGSQSL